MCFIDLPDHDYHDVYNSRFEYSRVKHSTEEVFENLVQEAKSVYLNSNEHTRSNTKVQTQSDRFNEWCKSKFLTKEYNMSAPIMHDLRSIKHPIEIDLLQHACNITEKGFKRVLNFGIWNWSGIHTWIFG